LCRFHKVPEVALSLRERPLVSIVIPSFNQGRFIAETLQSCLKQSYRPIEIIVQDGGSTDDTVPILRSTNAAELSWSSEPDRGVVDAVNKGLRRAKGSILTIQSSDDLFVDGAIQAAVDAILNNPSAGMVYGDVELIDEQSRVLMADVQGDFELAQYFGRLMYVPQPGTCFTAQALATVGGWREDFSFTADADLWFRIAMRFPVVKLSRLMARYRYHPLQRDRQKGNICRDWERMVRDLTQNPQLDWRTRRHAYSGIFLARFSYADPENWWQRSRSLYAALLFNPAAVLHPTFPTKQLLPAQDAIWKRLSRIKRNLGFRPKGT
jgi:glycosyltransferase involved in cell wall biosynthesis